MLTGWANQQASLGNACADCCEPLGALQELHNLHEVLLGLLNTGNVVEHHTSVGLHLETRLALACTLKHTKGWGSAHGVCKAVGDCK
jgi:hypothetical protein